MRTALLICLALFATAAAVDAQSFTVTGVAQYQDKAWNYNGWTGSDPNLPIRRADVIVLNNSTQAVLGSGSTGQDGSFSISCSTAGTTNVIVRIDCDTNLDGAFQRLRVTTESNVEYTAFSPVFNNHNPNNDLNAGTITAGKLTSGGDEANPFNMLDMAVSAAEYIASPDLAGGATVSTVRVNWPSGSGSFASGSQAHMSDDDGYDDAVILHELGHVFHNLYSDSDNTGGSHFFGDSDQDPRLSMGEGWATAFDGMVLDDLGIEALYQDANGSSQSGGSGLRLRIETAAPYANDSYGGADEVAVACVLFDLVDDEFSEDGSPGVDDEPFDSTLTASGDNIQAAAWNIFTGPINVASNLTVNHAWDGWFQLYNADPHHTEMQDVYLKRRMRFWEDPDDPNESQGTATPLAVGSWSGEFRLYYSPSDPPAPGTGDHDWIAVTLNSGDIVDIETRYPGGASDADTQVDPQISLFDPGGTLRASDEDGGTGRNAKIDNFLINQTGTWAYRVRSTDSMRRYGRYNTRVLIVSSNQNPTITFGPTASPSTITELQTSTLTVVATDPDPGQTLSYAWTPQSGGSISGTGAVVTFTPDSVTTQTVFPVQVVVSDNLGGQSLPAIVNVTVNDVPGICPSPATVTSAGVGKPGILGVPVLSAINTPVLPSNDFSLKVTNAFPTLQGYFIFGFSLISAPFDQGTMYPSPDVLLGLTVDFSGEMNLPLVLPSNAAFCGATFYVQALTIGDLGASGTQKSAQTNYLELVFGD
jgi:hypothetical protein